MFQNLIPLGFQGEKTLEAEFDKLLMSFFSRLTMMGGKVQGRTPYIAQSAVLRSDTEVQKDRYHLPDPKSVLINNLASG